LIPSSVTSISDAFGNHQQPGLTGAKPEQPNVQQQRVTHGRNVYTGSAQSGDGVAQEAVVGIHKECVTAKTEDLYDSGRFENRSLTVARTVYTLGTTPLRWRKPGSNLDWHWEFDERPRGRPAHGRRHYDEGAPDANACCAHSKLLSILEIST